jgi:hypothetical protein
LQYESLQACCEPVVKVKKGVKGRLKILFAFFLLQPELRRPDELAPDKGWTAEDKTIGLVAWSALGKPGRNQVGRQLWWWWLRQWVTEEATSEDKVLSGVTINNLILGKKDPLAMWANLSIQLATSIWTYWSWT